MNRNAYSDRIYLNRDEAGERRISAIASTGSEKALELATVLATMCSEDFLEKLIRHKAALDEWGGQIYIATAREKFDASGKLIEHREVGEYLTVGYIFHYGHRSQIKGQVQEPDTPLHEGEAPKPVEAIANGQPEPEPVEA